MLDELIDVIGLEYMENKLRSEMEIKNSLCIRVNEDGFLDSILIDKESNNMENLELKKWFSERLYYSESLSSNKSIVCSGYTSKIITSSIKQAVIFNIKTLTKKIEKIKEKISLDINLEELFYMSIDEYLKKLKCTESLISDNREKIFKVINDNIDKNIKVLIFEFDTLEAYKNQQDKYLEENLFDKGTKRYSGFLTLNNNKPLLSNIGGKTTEIQEYNYKDASKIYTLNRYLSKFSKMKNKFELENKGCIVLRYDVKEKQIINYEYIPQKEENNHKLNISIENVLREKSSFTSIVDYNFLVDMFNKYTDFSFNTKNKNSKKDVLYYKYGKMIKDFWGSGQERRYSVNKEFVDINIYKILEDIIEYNNSLDNKEEYKYFRISDVINFSICVEDYLKKNNKKGAVRIVKEGLFERLVCNKNNFKLKNLNEVAFISGQLAKYLTDKSNTVSKKNILVQKYHNSRSWSTLQKYLDNDLNKYMYKCSQREKMVYGEIIYEILHLANERNVLNKEERAWLQIGLYSDNIFYKKYEEI